MQWEMVELGKVADVIAGQSPPSEFYNKTGEGIPFFQGKADFGEMFPTVRYWCTKPTKIAEPGDVLFSVRAPVGPTNLNNVRACIGRGLSAIRVGNKLDVRYLLHYLRKNEQRIADLGTGSTFKAIVQADLKQIQIPLPPLAEQQRLAALLDTADALRRKDRDLLAHYDRLVQSVFLDLFGEENSLLGKEEIRNCIKIIGGYAFKSNNFKNEGIPVIKIGTVNRGFFDLSTLSFLPVSFLEKYKKWRVLPGDLLISLTGTVGKDDYGNVEIATNDYPNYLLNQRVAKIEFNSEKVGKEFLYHLFKQPFIKRELTGLSRGVRQANISNEDICQLKITLPPLPLQNHFAALVANIEAQKERVRAQSAQSEALFQGLLQRTFQV